MKTILIISILLVLSACSGKSGQDGVPGGPGPQGTAGVQGSSGNSLITNVGEPSQYLGQDSDSYIDSLTGKLYKKIGGAWVQVMTIATGAGVDGKSLIAQAGEPLSSAGKDGDSYIDQQTLDFYTKTNGEWLKVNNIKGTDGSSCTVTSQSNGVQVNCNGSSVVVSNGEDGATGPQGVSGVDGAQGPKGDQGDAGIQGPKGDKGDDGSSVLSGTSAPQSVEGKNGDLFVDVSTGDLYQKQNDSWILASNLKGAKGDQGDAGLDGQRGNSFLAGQDVPSESAGSDGDSYFDFLTANVWNKVNGVWNQIANLIGPKGDSGLQGAPGVDGLQGPKGDPGEPGIAGSSCHASQTLSGVTISCDDGTTATYSGDPTVKDFARAELPNCENGKTLSSDGANLICVNSESLDSSKLPLSGGVMSGEINMNDNRISNLSPPVDDTDAVTKSYVDQQTVNLTPSKTINITPTSDSLANGNALVSALTNLSNTIPTGDIIIKLGELPLGATYDLGSKTLTINQIFASRILIRGGGTIDTLGDKYTITTSATTVMEISSFSNLKELTGVTLTSTNATPRYGIDLKPSSSIAIMQNVLIKGGFSTGALNVQDFSTITGIKFSIDGTNQTTMAAEGAGIKCQNLARLSFRGNVSTITNIGSGRYAINASLGCNVISQGGSISISPGAGTATNIPKNTTQTDGSYITY